MPWVRILVEVALTVVVALLLATVGGLVAEPLLRWVATRASIDSMVMSSPTDIASTYAGIAAAFALPALATWLGAITHHVVARKPAGAAILGVVFVAASAGVALGVLWQAETIRSVMETLPEGGVAPMIGISSLDLGAAGIRMGSLVTAVTLSVVGWRLRRPRTTG